MGKTFSIKSADVTRQWIELDASQAPLGRLATAVANRLIGKHKPTYTPHIDGGDYVIVVNADKLVVTGNKLTDKKYHRHSGFPGGITTTSLSDQIASDSTKVITEAVRGMLPKNKLVTDRLKRLKVYAGPEHTHAPQNPVKVKVN